MTIGLVETLFLVLFIAVPIITLVTVLIVVRRKTETVPTGTPVTPALSILQERYARGEIGRDDYFLRKADLGG